MNKLDMESKNIINDNIEYIKEKFPNVIVETENGYEIDFNLLKQELSNVIADENKEKYQLTWPGKKEAILNSNIPTQNILRPLKEKSVDFDNTENIYIEGDNLEALKILQESYLNKIKCIYIDPPYNTGNDFIYNDNFVKDKNIELQKSGQIDEMSNKLISNNQSNGRFHSDWLSMMYSRLKLARNLLCYNGAIFISIDENEVVNIKKICDEIFGENNFVANIKILSNPRGRQSSLFFASAGEYVIVYAKNISELKIIGDLPNENQIATYNKEDNIGKYRELGLRKRGADSLREDSPTMYFPIYYDKKNDDIKLEKFENAIEIIPRLENGSEGRWRWSKSKILIDKNQLICREVKRNGNKEYDVFQKDYLDKNNRVKHKDFWIEKEINYDRSSEEIRNIFVEKIFDYAKPIYLIEKILNTIIEKNDIVLDFFSGSSTTAHAILKLNSEDSGNRKFIMVQLPEKINKGKFKTICDIGEERIRRVGAEILRNITSSGNGNINGTGYGMGINNLKEYEKLTGEKVLDYGFRVYKIDSSNMKDVYYKPNEINQEQLKMFESNIKEDRTDEDLLIQVILDLGLTLDLKIEEKNILNNKVYFVDGNSLVACFDDNINIDIIDEICDVKPLKIVLKDSSFKYDNDKINLQERIKKLSSDTEVSIL